MKPNLTYIGCGLDRSVNRRQDPDWINQRRNDRSSQIIATWRDSCLVSAEDQPAAALLEGESARIALNAAETVVFLGVDDSDRAFFVADLAAENEIALPSALSGGAFVDLRRISTQLSQADGALLAYARGLVLWHRHHRYCGVCGTPTVVEDGGHVRGCTSTACGRKHFPRTDPAVLMLVTRDSAEGSTCLLGRPPQWSHGLMSTLAGFVEPGESLEEAVEREIREEVGIVVDRIEYRGSQPWPFPGSVMIGFRAVASTNALIVTDPAELEEARWFSRDEIIQFEKNGGKLPFQGTLARELIDEWLRKDPDVHW